MHQKLLNVILRPNIKHNMVRVYKKRINTLCLLIQLKFITSSINGQLLEPVIAQFVRPFMMHE